MRQGASGAALAPEDEHQGAEGGDGDQVHRLARHVWAVA
jgi:hypothetical protein